MTKLKIGYFADGPWSHRAFQRLIVKDYLEFTFIVPRVDTTDFTLRGLADRYGIDYFSGKVNSDDFMEKIKDYNCDLFISLSFNQIFKKTIINLPRLKTINVHAGKLPFYRGRNVLNWAIINGEKEFGVTVHYIDEGLDTGDIIVQNTYPISEQDDYNSVLGRAFDYCADSLEEAVEQIYKGTAKRIPQESFHSTGFYCGGREPGDERLDWNQSSIDIYNFVRAINQPAGPGARTFINEYEIVINKVSIVKAAPSFKGNPGQVIGKNGEFLLVKTKDSWIKAEIYSSPVIIRIGDRFR